MSAGDMINLAKAIPRYVQCLVAAPREKLVHAKALMHLSPWLAEHAFARILLASPADSRALLSDVIMPFLAQFPSSRLTNAICSFCSSSAPRESRLAALKHISHAAPDCYISSLPCLLAHNEAAIRQESAAILSRHLDWYNLTDSAYAHFLIARADRPALIKLAGTNRPTVVDALIEACSVDGANLGFIGPVLAHISQGEALSRLLDKDRVTVLGWGTVAQVLGASAHEEVLRILGPGSTNRMPFQARHRALALLSQNRDPSRVSLARQAIDRLITDANLPFAEVRTSALVSLEGIRYKELDTVHAWRLAAARGDIAYLQDVALKDLPGFVSAYLSFFRPLFQYTSPGDRCISLISLLADVLKDFPSDLAYDALTACSPFHDELILDCLRLITVPASLLLNYLSAHKSAASAIMPLLSSSQDTPPAEEFLNVYADLPLEAQDAHYSYLGRYRRPRVSPSVAAKCVSAALSRVRYSDCDELLAPRVSPTRNGADPKGAFDYSHYCRPELPRSSRMLLRVVHAHSVDELRARISRDADGRTPMYIRAIGRLGSAPEGKMLLELLRSMRLPLCEANFSSFREYADARLKVAAVVHALGSLRYKEASNDVCALWLQSERYLLEDECLRAMVLMRSPCLAIDHLLPRFMKGCDCHLLPEKGTRHDQHILRRHVRLMYRALYSVTAGCIDELSRDTIAALRRLPHTVVVDICRDNPDAGFYGGETRDNLGSLTICLDGIHRLLQLRSSA